MAYQITDACVKCGSCAEQCPVGAIDLLNLAANI